MTAGTVQWFCATRGYGFIAPDDGGRDVFVHVAAVRRAGMETLVAGQRIGFERQRDPHGVKAEYLTEAE